MSRPTTEQQNMIKMLHDSKIAHSVEEDSHDPERVQIVIKNRYLDGGTQVDIVFQFRNHNLDRMWVRHA